MEARRAYDKVVRNRNITKGDMRMVELLANGTISAENLNLSQDRVEAITQVADLKKKILDAKELRSKYAQKKRSEATMKAVELVKNSATYRKFANGTWRFNLNTAERVIRAVVPEGDVDTVMDTLVRPIQKAEGDRVQFKKKFNDRILALGLDHSESVMTQLVGEKLIKLEDLQNIDLQEIRKAVSAKDPWGTDSATGRLAKYVRSGDLTMKDLNRAYDTERISNAVNTIRSTYEELFDLVNAKYEEWGYEPMEHRADYFPHFIEENGDGVLAKIAAKLRIQTGKNLNTDIAGTTETRRPGRNYNSHAIERTGQKTVYDALKGMDEYLETASKIIYQTDNIQQWRAFETALRYEWSDESVKSKVDAIRDADIEPIEKEQQILQLMEDAQRGSDMGAFATWVRSYTDTLAGKKSIGDRQTEQEFGRGIYTIANSLQKKAAANMVAINPGSWLTQFIPIQQGLAAVDSDCSLKAIVDTMRAVINDDGFGAQSDFLRARESPGKLSTSGTEKVINAISSPQGWIDRFSCEVVTRAKYYEGIKRGFDQESAMKRADAHARNVIAGRAQGDVPLYITQKNPITRALFQFQLEQINQYEYLFRDLPKEFKERGVKFAVETSARYLIGAYVMGALFKLLTGRDPTLNPVGETVDVVKRFADPNTNTMDDISATAKSLIEDIPVIGGFLGGGRIAPFTSTLPDAAGLLEVAGNQLFADEEDKWDKWMVLDKVYKGVSGPLYYYMLPAGGGQIKKAVEGINVVARGGAYTQTADGEKLRYKVDQNAGNYARAAVFGKSSLPETQAYYDNGGNGMSVKMTKSYKEAVAAGIEADTFLELIDKEKTIVAGKYSDGKTIPLSKGRKTKKMIDETEGLTQEQKKLLYEAFGVPESLWK